MRAIDGQIRIRAREQGERWPNNALCDLSVESSIGPSAAVYMTESDVRTLILRLREQLPPPRPDVDGLAEDGAPL